MANKKRVVRKRKDRKNIEKGAVHIRSSFNNTMDPRISVRGGIFNDSLTFINSLSGVSLKRNPPIREKASIPVSYTHLPSIALKISRSLVCSNP